MKALDTNVLVRFLLNDDKTQGARANELFEDAEADGRTFQVTNPVLLELIWVLTAVYGFTRAEVLEALELIAGMPVLELESYDFTIQLITRGRSTGADLPDLFIGLWAAAKGCETTLTFEKGLVDTGLFERI